MADNLADTVYLRMPREASSRWWDRYVATLKALTPTARAALLADCRFVVSQGIFGGGQAEEAWPPTRVHTGLVMGSVQSGKTASMFGVAALALDLGIDIVVILAGTRLSLWRQTYERLAIQLDAGADNAAKVNRRLLCPALGTALTGRSSSVQDIYRLSSPQVRRRLRERNPIIVVAMKQTDHLYALGAALRGSVFPTVCELDRPVRLLVLDDEADDGSVLDAVVEGGRDPLWSGYKQIPRAIADLWDPQSESAPTNLFTTYVGYTATPQANLLQEDHNPLAPRDFIISLRTPLDVGDPAEPAAGETNRSVTYPEPTGLDNYYTGGDVFYRRASDAGLCEELTGQPEEDLGNAVRAFLVATAIRLYWADGKGGPRSLAAARFESEEAVYAASPPPSSMLFHPAADIAEHFRQAEELLLWAGVEDREIARELIESGDAHLPAALIGKLQCEEELWKIWRDRYKYSSTSLAAEFNVIGPRVIPDWSTIKHLLETEVIQGTRVSVVNSDPNADDRPDYKPQYDSENACWRAARDQSTIFVAGNVMARGLTLEGMTTALFQRSSSLPFADTQMQMQRWFGYRGRYIELCRLFASKAQLDLFRSYHDIDEAIRIAIATRKDVRAPSPVVLHGLEFLATGKIAGLGRTPLCSGSKPFVTLMNSGAVPDPNVQSVADLFASDSSSDVVVGGRLRGRALDREFSLVEVAEFLDSLRYDDYRPGGETPLEELWSQVQARVSAVYPLPLDTKLYNPPSPSQGGAPTPAVLSCPYTTAAYFRLWDACLTRPVRGLFITGAPGDLWSMADLGEKRRHQPRFSIGIRYGSGASVNVGPLAKLGFSIPATAKRVGVHGGLETAWGSNDPDAGQFDYRGDEYFDYYHRDERIPLITSTNPWRPAGSYGQVLFYINQLPNQLHPVVALGICIPAGGPEQFAATRASAPVAVG